MEPASDRAAVDRPRPGKTNDKEVVAMSETLGPARSRSWAVWATLGLSVLAARSRGLHVDVPGR